MINVVPCLVFRLQRKNFCQDISFVVALGLEKAGFEIKALVEIDKKAASTLRKNRPKWNVLDKDVREVNFKKFRGKIDLVSGGFPCQPFSHAGNKLGFDDVRGTVFYEFARAIKEIRQKCLWPKM